MKKLITLISALAMVFAFAGVSLAEDLVLSCRDTVDSINRGCPDEVAPQSGDTEDGPIYFDFNDTSTFDSSWAPLDDAYSYCVDKKVVHRALIDVCNCNADWTDVPAAGDDNDTINIKMEILVNDATGSNGVYWAEEVQSIALHTDNCDDGTGTQDPSMMCERSYNDGSSGDFNSMPIWYDEDGFRGSDSSSGDDKLARYEDFYMSPQFFKGPFNQGTSTVLYAGNSNTTGFKLTDDVINGKECIWGVDIPAMYIDLSDPDLKRDDVIKVRITLTPTSSGGICGEGDTCSGEIIIGKMCCIDDAASGSIGTELVFPFMPKLYGYYDAQGLVVTNLTKTSGDAEVRMYEADGDVFTKTYTVGANSPKIIGTMDFDDFDLEIGNGDGELGADGGYFVVVNTEFTASGLAFFYESLTGASLGYLPATPETK